MAKKEAMPVIEQKPGRYWRVNFKESKLAWKRVVRGQPE